MRLRPEHEGFKLGVYKAQKAIENAIGAKTLLQQTELPPLQEETKFLQTDDNANITIVSNNNNNNKSRASTATVKQSQKSGSSSRSGGGRAKTAKGSRLLRELAPDKVYLENLMKNPNLRCKGKEEDDRVVQYIRDAVDFLNSRQEFWRQQLPPHLK